MSNDTNEPNTSDPHTSDNTTMQEQMEQSIFSLVVSLWKLKVDKLGKAQADTEMLALFDGMSKAFNPEETAI